MSNGSLWSRLDQWTRISRLSFPVPAHAKNLGYCLGGITLMGFAILFATGLILTQFFNPQTELANKSVHYIAEQVTGGRFLRSFHYWTAQAVVLAMCAHLLRVFIKPDVSTVCIGLAASMGATLLAAGKSGKRFALPNAEILLHQVAGGVTGQAVEIEITAKQIIKIKEKLNKILAKHTGQPLAKIEKDTDRDFYLSAEEAKEYGLIDQVIKPKG